MLRRHLNRAAVLLPAAILAAATFTCVSAFTPECGAKKTRVSMRASAAALKGGDVARGATSLPGIAVSAAVRDSLAAAISFVGYEKTASATREEFMIVNATAQSLAGVSVTLTYTDMLGRMLHKRAETLTVEIPPGETRRVQLTPFTKSKNYYYHAGEAPRTDRATPYDITVTLDSIYLPRSGGRNRSGGFPAPVIRVGVDKVAPYEGREASAPMLFNNFSQ